VGNVTGAVERGCMALLMVGNMSSRTEQVCAPVEAQGADRARSRRFRTNLRELSAEECRN